jgi:predicted transcriptional regulator of viral defense system
MRAPRALDALRRLGQPVVSTAEAAAALKVSVDAANKALSRLAGDGAITRVARGLWAVRPPLDPLLLPNHLTSPYPAYVSLWTSLHVHGVIEQIPAMTYVVTLGRSRRVTTTVGTFSLHHVIPELFDGWEWSPAGVALASIEKALFDLAYLSSTRNRSFASFPEVELPRRVNRAAIGRWIEQVPSSRLQAVVRRRLAFVM